MDQTSIKNTLQNIDREVPNNIQKKILRPVINTAIRSIKPLLPNNKWKRALQYYQFDNFEGQIFIKKSKDTWTELFYEVGRKRVTPKFNKWLTFWGGEHIVQTKSAMALSPNYPVLKGMELGFQNASTIMQNELQKILDQQIK